MKRIRLSRDRLEERGQVLQLASRAVTPHQREVELDCPVVSSFRPSLIGPCGGNLTTSGVRSPSYGERRLREAAGVEDVSIHDMRRAISNWLKDQGVSREVRDLILNHKDFERDGKLLLAECTHGEASSAGVADVERSRVGDYRAGRWCEQRSGAEGLVLA